ncbi:MAG TPA: TMEM14 family protein, partial [Rhabdochlamydiaceae bacterium]|nr:TMEM14 family protein [Rhabdochlamydiaceae bacterium]
MIPYIVALYGVLIFAGGIIGYLKAGSEASLVMGGISGLLLLISSGGMFSKKYFKKAVFFTLVLTLILDAFFSYRFMTTMKFLPSGLLALVSIGVIIGLVAELRRSS